MLTTSIGDMLDELTSSQGPFLSVYLPYGISGIDGDKAATERKNTLQEARRRLKGEKKWLQKLKEIEQSAAHTARQNPGQLTGIYIATPDDTHFTTLPAKIKPHFAFAEFPQTEPLVYYNWYNDQYEVLVFDLEVPKLIRGYGRECYEAPIAIPDTIRELYGADFADYSLDNICNIADRDRAGRPDLDSTKSSPNGGLHGLSSRQISKRDKDITYWLKIVEPIFKENINPHCKTRFLAADDGVSQIILDHAPSWSMDTDHVFPLATAQDFKQLADEILSLRRIDKLRHADEEIQASNPTRDIKEILQLLETGQVQTLFVEQRDTIMSDNHNRREYEFTNPRAALINKALRYHTKIEYTKLACDNQPGIAALPH